MPKITINSDLSALCQRLSAHPRHGRHVASLCDLLFSRLRHLHGLTRTSRPLLQAAALLHDLAAAEGKPDQHLRGRDAFEKLRDCPLTPSQRHIVGEAIALHARQSDVEGFCARIGRGPHAAQMDVAARLAAILRIADGLDHARTRRVGIAGIIDDGEAIDIYVTGGPDAAEGAASAVAKTDLWNRVALRPVRSIALLTQGDPPDRSVRPGEPVTEAARRILQHHLEQLISREYGLGYAEDIEYVHEMRVATRRLRAAMRVFRRAVVGGFRRERGQMKLLADALGSARDHDVFMLFLQTYARDLPELHRPFFQSLLRSERRKRRLCHRRLLETFADPADARFRQELHRALRLPAAGSGPMRPAGGRGYRCLWREARRALRRGLRACEPFGRQIERLSAARQHQLRIACKRLRYTGEFFAEIYPPQLQKLIATAVRMQDLLGEVHDADVYGMRMRQFFDARRARTRDPGAADAVQAALAWLQSRRQEWLAEAARTWRSFTSPRRHKQIAECIESPIKS